MLRADHAVSFFGFALAGLGLGALGLTLTTLPPAARPGPVLNTPLQQPTDSAAQDRSWPALFGVAPPVAAPVQVAAAPASPDFALKGLVASGTGGWAIVAGPDGDQLVNPGSTLPGGAVVIAIKPGGVEIEQAGQRYSIGFQQDTPPLADRPLEAAPQITTSSLSLKDVRKTGFQRMLGLAGGSKVVDQGNGVLAQEITWVRKGRLYDRVGLQTGDIILAINGVPAGDTDALLATAPELIRERSFDLDVIRAGARITVKVTLNDDL